MDESQERESGPARAQGSVRRARLRRARDHGARPPRAARPSRAAAAATNARAAKAGRRASHPSARRTAIPGRAHQGLATYDRAAPKRKIPRSLVRRTTKRMARACQHAPARLCGFGAIARHAGGRSRADNPHNLDAPGVDMRDFPKSTSTNQQNARPRRHSSL